MPSTEADQLAKKRAAEDVQKLATEAKSAAAIKAPLAKMTAAVPPRIATEITVICAEIKSIANIIAKNAKEANILAKELCDPKALFVADRIACLADNAKKTYMQCADIMCIRYIEAHAETVRKNAKRARTKLASLIDGTYYVHADAEYEFYVAHLKETKSKRTIKFYMGLVNYHAAEYWFDTSAEDAKEAHNAVDKFTANATVLSIVTKAFPSGIAQTALSIVTELAWLDAFEAPQRAADAAQHAAEVAQSAANLLAKAYKIPCMAYPEPVNRERHRQGNDTLGQKRIDKAFHRATDAAKLATDAAKLAAKRTAQHSKGAAE